MSGEHRIQGSHIRLTALLYTSSLIRSSVGGRVRPELVITYWQVQQHPGAAGRRTPPGVYRRRSVSIHEKKAAK